MSLCPQCPESVRALLLQSGSPGASVAVVSGGAPIVWCWGDARIRPRRAVGPQTIFHLFSGTKLYTATALMIAVQQGTLELDQPVSDVLPELQLRHPITLRQLASHTSGLPETLRGLLAVHFVGDRAPSAGEALARYATARGRAPGRSVAYRNVNYAILGSVLARVMDQPFAQLLQQQVLDPLSSRATLAYDGPALEAAAVGYMPRLSPLRLVLRLIEPATAGRLYAEPEGRLIALQPYVLDTAAIGGLLGSASDFVPLLQEMLDPGDGLLSAESKQVMLTAWSRGAAGIVSREGVGIGWKQGLVDGIPFWNHEGGGAGFCSETRIYPDQGLGIVVLMNRSQSVAISRIAHRICEEIRSLAA